MGSVREKIWTNKGGKKGICYFLDYVDLNGNRVREGSFRRKFDAKTALNEIENNINKGLNGSVDKDMTFEQASNDYIKYNTELYCKPSTIETYKRYLRVHLMPFFGGMKLASITVQKVQEFIKHQLDTTKLSNNSINKNVVLLGSIIQKQVDEGTLFVNSVYKAKKLKVETKEMRALGREEVQKLLDTCKKHDPDFYPMLLTSIMTGMRRGELLALTWDKVNWIKAEILVNKSLYKGQMLSPKTQTSIRRVNINEELLRVLREWQLKSGGRDDGFIFPNENGNGQDPRNLVRRRFEPVIKRAGIGKLRWHDMRHTFASIQIAQNPNIKYVQAQMGHSSSKITLDRYGHLLPEVHEQGLKAFDFLFAKKEELKLIM